MPPTIASTHQSPASLVASHPFSSFINSARHCCVLLLAIAIMTSGPGGPSRPSPCSTNKNMDTTNPTPTATSNTDVNVDSCGTQHATEDEGDTLVLGKQRRFISKIWKHYNYEVISGVPKAICKYCKKQLGGVSRNGTKHLNDHHAICPMKRHRDMTNDFTKKKLKIEPSSDMTLSKRS